MGEVIGPSADFNRRWDRGWRSVPVPVILLATIVFVVRSPASAGEILLTVLLVVALLAWHGWFVFARSDWVESRVGPMVCYLAGYLALAAALALRDPVFTAAVVVALPTAFSTLPGRWAYLGVIATGAVLILLAGLTAPLDVIATIILGSAGAAAIGWGFRRLEGEARHRLALSAELAEANDALRAATSEAARLQQETLQAERAVAVAGERTRLAGELHDTLVQGLAGVSAQLETAEELLAHEHPARHRVSSALELARSSQVEARRSVHALRSGELTEHELVAALRRTVHRWQDQTGTPASFGTVGRVGPLPPDAEQGLLRVAQEALANVAKHSRARRVTVTLTALDDEVALDVVDDGCGFEVAATPEPGPGGGHGLPTMRHRVAALHGAITIESAPGDGTALSARIPTRAGGRP